MDKIEFGEGKITFSYKKSYGDCLYQDLIAVEYGKPQCMIQIEGRGSILFLISLHDVLEKLPANFLLINRGIIVNIEHVTDLVCLDGVYHVKMDNNKIYRISTRKVAILKRTLMAKSDTIQVQSLEEYIEEKYQKVLYTTKMQYIVAVKVSCREILVSDMGQVGSLCTNNKS